MASAGFGDDDETWSGFGDPEFNGKVRIEVKPYSIAVAYYIPVKVGSAEFQRFSSTEWVQTHPMPMRLSPNQCEVLEQVCKDGIAHMQTHVPHGMTLRSQNERSGF